MMISNYISAISIIIATVYCLLIIYQIVGLYRANRQTNAINDNKLGISLIIPFRNEASNIKNIQSNIYKLKGSDHDFEVIWVDDNSEDKGSHLIEINDTTKIVFSKGIGKKAALTEGIKRAKYPIIATLDADVSIENNWLLAIRFFFKNTDKHFLILPILIKNGKGIWGNYESLDVLSLTGSTISWAAMGRPIMCNGANMAFYKKLFTEHRLECADEGIASGDDLFFLHQVKARSPESIGYLQSKHSVAKVDAFNEAKGLINQRVRWVSKSGNYTDRDIQVVSWIVMIEYASILVLGIMSIFFPWLIRLFSIILISKFMIDYLYLFLLAKKLDSTRQLAWYPVAAIVQLVLVPLVLLTSLSGGYNWKGRDYE